MSKQKVLVTGGAGFIGSNLAIQLLKNQVDVTCIDDFSSGYIENANDITNLGGNFVVGDYGSQDCTDLIQREKFDVVFHVGAIPRVLYSIENPIKTTECNINATLRLLEACRNNIGRFVFSSSSSVVGDIPVNISLPTDERIPRMPRSPYAAQKSFIEDLCRIYSECHNLDTINLRYFNVYGRRQYADSPYSTVISAWCNALDLKKPLRIDGDGSQTRDFCHVDNVVSANLLAMESSNKFRGEAINIAHGETRSIKTLLELFQQRFKFETINAPSRQGDVAHTHADITLAKSLIGYEPLTSFDDGLISTWRWWRLI